MGQISMNHSEFNTLLRDRFRQRSPVRRNVRLPSEAEIRFSGDLACMKVFMSATAVQSNMQDDVAAFEGWSLVLMAWCGVKQIVLDWNEPTDVRDGHYQRFLYRLGHLNALLGPDIVRIMQPERLGCCRIGNGSVATLNLAGHRDVGDRPLRPGSEADLERRLAGGNPAERCRLMAGLGLFRLDRQMPVGVFDGPPRRAGAIFTGGKSAIDLVGLGTDGALWLLELKTARNIKVGALSELFFYSMVLNDARQGRIAFHNKRAGPRSTISQSDICAATRIRARVLAEASHPLLSSAAFDILTAAAAAQGWTIDYGFHDLGSYLDKASTTHATPI